MSSQRSIRHLAASLLAVAILGCASAAAAVELVFLRPMAGEPAYGAVEVNVAVVPADAALQRIEIYLDGKRVGVLDRPPYRVVADAGLDNAEHRFEAVAYAGGRAVASTSIRTPRFQVDEEIKVELRQIFLNVGRRDGSVPVLGKGDFSLSDEGDRQEITSFERGDVPFTAALLVDASTSMQGGRLEAALDAARGFVSSLRSLDEVKLMLFSDRVQGETPFTSIPTVLSVGLAGVKAQGGTALSDALFLALKRLEERRGRKVVILLSDGIDIESVISMEEAARLARRIQASIYWLRLRKPSEIAQAGLPVARFSVWRNAQGHRRELDALAEAVADTGGRIQPIDSLDQVKGALAGLLGELRSQYILGYYPSASLGAGKWHDVRVQVQGMGYVVRAQKGYTED
jgi:Ca-activated chloride channel family protein